MTAQKLDDLELMFLEHYGVLGMKWGVRRSQAQLDRAAGRKTSKKKASLGSSTPAKKKKASLGSSSRTNNSSKARLGGRSVSQIGDRELREITNRMEMERKYNQLSTPSKSRGKKILDGMKTFNDVVNTTSNTYKNGKKIVDLGVMVYNKSRK